MNKQLHRLTLLIVVLSVLLAGKNGWAEGSRDLYPSGAQGSRANSEWRTNTYSGLLLRRTLLKVYANAGEYICLGSSAVGVGSGDAFIYDAGGVSGPVGGETFGTPVFQATTAQPGLGQITSRTQELAGAQSITASGSPSQVGNPNGYAPAYYQAPATGLYSVVFYGPSGGNANSDGGVSSDVALTNSGDFNSGQGTSIAAWDVTVRADATSTTDLTGRLFANYLALFTGGNGRPIYPTVYAATLDGYQYRIDLRGVDPNGFILYGNQIGFLDSDGSTPLYHDILGQDGQISSPEGGVSLSLPNYPVFFNRPDSAALSADNIPLSAITPVISGLRFTGNLGGNNSRVSSGGTFSYTANIPAVYQIVISRDGVDFDPTNPNNRSLRSLGTSGGNTVAWDGKDNNGNDFPVGNNYAVQATIHGGEYHFPMLDAENDLVGGPTFTLLNASNSLGNTTGFYDDRGYRTAGGYYVTYSTSSSAASSNNSALVSHVLGGLNPPATAYSNPLTGFDTSSAQRAYGNYGNSNGGNSNSPNIGSFGDTKGLDIWTYTPSSASSTTLNILTNAPPTVLLVKRITAINGVDVTGFTADPSDTDDANPDWPSPAATYLRGGLSAADVKPGDIVDYTIYFLVTGTAVGAFTLCDALPANMTFIPDAYDGLSPTDGGLAGTDYGIALASSTSALPNLPSVYLSNVADSDRGQFYAPGTAAPAASNRAGGFAAPLPAAQNTNGVVAVTVVSGANTLPAATTPGSPVGSYGFVRFRVRVN